MHIGNRRAGPLFLSRQRTRSGARTYTRQRIGQMVREVARGAGIGKRIDPHLLRHTMATRRLALGMHITDIQKFLGHEDIGATRIYAETSVAMLRRKFDQVTDRARSDVVGAFAADLLTVDGHTFNTSADA